MMLSEENDMRIALYIAIILIAFLIVLCYALVVIAHDADERAEEMHRKWKESKDEAK